MTAETAAAVLARTRLMLQQRLVKRLTVQTAIAAQVAQPTESGWPRRRSGDGELWETQPVWLEGTQIARLLASRVNPRKRHARFR